MAPSGSWSASCTAPPASISWPTPSRRDRKTYNCRVIPERGSWIELNVSKKDTLQVRIDQSGKFSALTLLRAMDPKYSRDSEILKLFYKTEKLKTEGGRYVAKIEGKIAVDDVVYPKGSERAGEIIVDAGLQDHPRPGRADLHLRAQGHRGDARAEGAPDRQQPPRGCRRIEAPHRRGPEP